MGKTMIMFPGQGSQYVGMGKDFYENVEASKKVYETAEAVTGMDVKKLCFEENEQLNITEYTQIAMLATEAAIYAAVADKGVQADVFGGLSLGEYGALIASQVMSMEDAFRVVKYRGKYMQDAYPIGGAMSAVLGLDSETIAKVCEETEGIVSIANYNCPGQIVISGEKDAVEKASLRLKEAGARRVIPLKVSGPFHSALLEDAGKKLKEVLNSADIQSPKTPYFSNVTGGYVKEASKETIVDLLERQVSSSVRWQQAVEQALQDGVTRFIEVGPGHTLSGFMKKINKDKEIQVINIEKLEDLDQVC